MAVTTIDHTLKLRVVADTWTALCACGWTATMQRKPEAVREHVLHVRQQNRLVPKHASESVPEFRNLLTDEEWREAFGIGEA